MAKEMEVDFVIAAWRSFAELFARLLVQELNKDDLDVYFTGQSRDNDDHVFFLFRRSDDGNNNVCHLATVSFLPSIEAGRGRELDAGLTFVKATQEEQRRIKRVALRILANIVAVYTFPRVTHKGKMVAPQEVPEPY